MHCGFHFHFLFLCDTDTGPTPGCCCLSPHGLDRANYVIISFDYFVWLMLMGNSARRERGGECDRSLQWRLFSCHFAALPAPPTVYLLACSSPAGLCFGWFLVRFRFGFRSRFRFECNCIIMMNVLLIEGKFRAHTEPRPVPLPLSNVTRKGTQSWSIPVSLSCCCLYLSVAYLAKQIRTRRDLMPCVWTNHVSV